MDREKTIRDYILQNAKVYTPQYIRNALKNKGFTQEEIDLVWAKLRNEEGTDVISTKRPISIGVMVQLGFVWLVTLSCGVFTLYSSVGFNPKPSSPSLKTFDLLFAVTEIMLLFIGLWLFRRGVSMTQVIWLFVTVGFVWGVVVFGICTTSGFNV